MNQLTVGSTISYDGDMYTVRAHVIREDRLFAKLEPHENAPDRSVMYLPIQDEGWDATGSPVADSILQYAESQS